MTNVCVIGAGIAGLSAAIRLKRAGYAVTVYEREATVGGRAATRERDGMRYSTGANIFYGFSPAMRALVAENGLESAVRPLPRLQARCIGAGGEWSVDMTPNPLFLASRDFSIAEKLRLGRFIGSLVLGAREADGDDACSTLAFDGETLRAFCEPRLGPGLTEKMVGIVYRSARGMTLDDISPSTFVSMMRALVFDRSVMAVDGGIGAIAGKLGDDLNVSNGVNVVDVAERPHDCLVTSTYDGTVGTLAFDVAVVAVEGNRAGEIVSTMPAEERAFFDKVAYNATIYCHCLFAGSHRAGQWFLSGPRFQWLSAVKVSPATDDGAAAAHVTMTVAPEIIRRMGIDIADDDILHHCSRELALLLPTVDAPPRRWFVQRIRNKTPLFGPGYGLAAARFRDLQTAPRKRVLYCGDYLYQPLLGGAALSGMRIADHVMRHYPLPPVG